MAGGDHAHTPVDRRVVTVMSDLVHPDDHLGGGGVRLTDQFRRCLLLGRQDSPGKLGHSVSGLSRAGDFGGRVDHHHFVP